MKKFVVSMLILICLCLTGCAGLGDYAIELSGRYELWRNSGENKHICISDDEYSCGGDDSQIVPKDVIELDFDEKHIIAKQIHYVYADDNDFFGTPEYDTLFYWIVDVKEEKSYGPFTYDEFNSKRKEIGVSIDLKLKSLDKFPKT